MDTYKHYCASAIAATVVLRSLLGAVFPLFTAGLFKKLGERFYYDYFSHSNKTRGSMGRLCVRFPRTSLRTITLHIFRKFRV